MKRFIIMLTLSAIMTILMGMSALPAQADITTGVCQVDEADQCSGGGDGGTGGPDLGFNPDPTGLPDGSSNGTFTPLPCDSLVWCPLST